MGDHTAGGANTTVGLMARMSLKRRSEAEENPQCPALKNQRHTVHWDMNHDGCVNAHTITLPVFRGAGTKASVSQRSVEIKVQVWGLRVKGLM
jgi:hypothetical protein